MKEGNGKDTNLNLPMIIMTSMPGLGVIIEADRWSSPSDIAKRCLEEKRPVIQFMRCLALGGRHLSGVLYVSTEEEQ
jgi:hypothetical protein